MCHGQNSREKNAEQKHAKQNFKNFKGMYNGEIQEQNCMNESTKKIMEIQWCSLTHIFRLVY